MASILHGGAWRAPLRHRTVNEALAAVRGLDGHGFTFVHDDGTEHTRSYAWLAERAGRVARALLDRGLRPGDRVVLVLPDNEAFIGLFLGCVWAGLVPVPIYPPLGVGRLAGYLDHARHIVDAARASALVTDRTVQKVLGSLLVRCRTLRAVLVHDEVDADASAPLARVAPEDPCFIQFTSGSTSRPKGVVVSHGNLAANIRCIGGEGIGLGPDDCGVSWLPLYHDMGLIGFVLTPLFYETRIVSIPPMVFLKRPHVWLEAISRHRGTISFAPNFAYALVARRARKRQLEGLDLSSWRIAGCGAEPIRRETLDAFAWHLAPAGFRREALFPVYGMAEATLAVSFGPQLRGVVSDAVDPRALAEAHRAEPFGANLPDGADPAALPEPTHVVSCGAPFPEHDLAVLGPDGAPVPERQVGEIALRGPSVMAGYFDDPAATGEALRDGWLRTGDLGYVAGGELHVCGRTKELIIVGGKNFYPQDIERVAWDIPGVRTGNVVAFGARTADSEEVVLALEVRDDGVDREALAAEARRRVQEQVGVTPREVVVLAKGSLPKTSSGKLQRRRAAELHAAGRLTDARDTPSRLGLARALVGSQLGYVRAFLARVATLSVFRS